MPDFLILQNLHFRVYEVCIEDKDILIENPIYTRKFKSIFHFSWHLIMEEEHRGNTNHS